MWIHFLILILIYLITYFGCLHNKKSKYMFIGLFLLFYVFAAFRSLEVGNDTQEYYRIFRLISNQQSLTTALTVSRYEVGYIIYNYVISRVTSNFQWILAINSGVYIGASIWFVNKYSTSFKKAIIDKYRYNVEVRTQKRKELDLSDEFVIGNVGSFKPQKNQQFLINVFNELLNEVPQKAHYRLMLVGEGALRTELEKKVNELGIKSYVLFTGSRDDVDELLQAMDVYALPSLYEGLPVTGIEAQAAGLPCIFSDTITKEVKICNTKYLSLDDEYAWAREILKLQYFERKDTSDIVHKRGYDIKMEAKKLEDYYRSLV